MAPKEVPVICSGVISLDSVLQLFNSSNGFLLVTLVATRQAVALLPNILSCQVNQYSCLDTLNIKIFPSLMQWANAVGLEKKVTEKTQPPNNFGFGLWKGGL